MEIISGTLKSLNNTHIFIDVKCEFEFDSCGGIKDGIFPDLLSRNLDEYLFIGKRFYFKSDDIVMSIYINRIINYDIHFQTIRLKQIIKNRQINKLTFFITKTGLIHGQRLKIDGVELLLSSYSKFSAVEFKDLVNVTPNLMKKFKNIVENVLLYIELIQIQYCNVFGYVYTKCLYINYSDIEFKPFIYNRAKTFKGEDLEIFITKFKNSPYKDYLTKIIHRLVSAQTSKIVEIRYVWLIFALEAIESVYNMKKTMDIKTSSNNHIRFNNIIDKILPENDLVKIYFGKRKFWKSLLWVYRDKYVHFLGNVNDLNDKPDKGQEEKLGYIFNDDYNMLTTEFKKLLPIAQRIICEVIDIDFENTFLHIY